MTERLRIAREDLIYTVWVPVHIPAVEIKTWIANNVKGEWTQSWVPGSSMSGNRKYDFELEDDALWFKLRWS